MDLSHCSALVNSSNQGGVVGIGLDTDWSLNGLPRLETGQDPFVTDFVVTLGGLAIPQRSR